MIPRKSLASWQEFAQRKICAQFGFASRMGLRNDVTASAAAFDCRRFGQNCYPFPSSWPDPLWVRSFFASNGFGRRVVANCVTMRIFPFASAGIVVESANRTTNIRGSSKCGKQFFSSLFSPCRWQAVLAARNKQIRPQPAPALARLVVRLLGPSPTTNLLNRHWSAARVASWLSTRACAADRLALQSDTVLTASRGAPRLAVSISTPAHRKNGLGLLWGESHV
jgi:hypothetical protein